MDWDTQLVLLVKMEQFVSFKNLKPLFWVDSYTWQGNPFHSLYTREIFIPLNNNEMNLASSSCEKLRLQLVFSLKNLFPDFKFVRADSNGSKNRL